MAKEPGEPRVIAKPQREHVVFAVEHDRLPPPVGEALLRDDEVARRDLVPAARQATPSGGGGGSLGGGRFAGRGFGDAAVGFGLGHVTVS